MDYPKITEQDICEIEREDGFREEIIKTTFDLDSSFKA